MEHRDTVSVILRLIRENPGADKSGILELYGEDLRKRGFDANYDNGFLPDGEAMEIHRLGRVSDSDEVVLDDEFIDNNLE